MEYEVLCPAFATQHNGTLGRVEKFLPPPKLVTNYTAVYPLTFPSHFRWLVRFACRSQGGDEGTGQPLKLQNHSGAAQFRTSSGSGKRTLAKAVANAAWHCS